jgi:hypothetical protein
MSFGIGAFPFGIFATAFNINDGRPPPGKPTFLKSGIYPARKLPRIQQYRSCRLLSLHA